MKIGILTSGGDAPGMNAAIRAVVRTAIYHKIDVYGINRGYAGLLDKDISTLNVYSAADSMQTGGTILRTSRSEFFPTEAGQKRAAEVLREYGIEHLIIIGGEGGPSGGPALQHVGGGGVGIPGPLAKDFCAHDFCNRSSTAVPHTLFTI